jgi:hypothetical protein
VKIKKGQLVTLIFEGKEFEAIVIDPNGLGEGQPTVGFGFNMIKKHTGIPQSTLSTWVHRENEEQCLKLPSKKEFRYIEIMGTDGKTYNTVEASDWFELAFDLIDNPGKTNPSLKTKLTAFLRWFAIKGFYAEAYTVIKGAYTAKDSRTTTKWLEMRQMGKLERKFYTDLLQNQGCQNSDYAYWTDYVYQGLFGMTAKKMKEVWALIDGNEFIARNYIPEVKGLEAVRYCEDMVVRLFIDDLEEAHDDAISYARRKFMSNT